MADISLNATDGKFQRQVGKARQALSRGEGVFARDILRRLLESEPGCLEVRELLHQARQGQASETRAGVGKLLGRAMDWPKVQKLRRLLARQPLDALVEVERWLEADPGNSQALRLLGDAALTAHFPATAAFAYREALRRGGADLGLLLALGEASLIAADHAGAVQAAEQALKLAPGHPGASELLKKASVAESLTDEKWQGS